MKFFSNQVISGGRSSRVLRILSISIFAFLGLSLINASAGSTTADVLACINEKTGVVRIRVNEVCSPRETPFQWIINGLKGSTGPRGAQILVGTVAPPLFLKDIGEIGDYYISNSDVSLYGPKSDKGWPKTGIRLQGATGAASTVVGPQGVAGVAGVASVAGVAGAAGAAGPQGPAGAADYAIGDLGPAGGVIFMIPSRVGNTTGKYFEAAPADLSGPGMAWCSVTDKLNTTLTAIGTGAANTLLMDAGCTSGAGQAAADYTVTVGSTTYSDWFLPSKNELRQLYVYHGVIRGLQALGHWSSSESSHGHLVWVQDLEFGQYDDGKARGGGYYVRPVRAFS